MKGFMASLRNTISKMKFGRTAHERMIMPVTVSEITVKAHQGKVMQKMKADSLADLGENGCQAPPRARGDCASIALIFSLVIIREDTELADSPKSRGG
jgi:hypothetical protein